MSLTAQKFGKRPSELLGLEDEVIALDFDIAGALRLVRWEDERNAAMFGGNKESDAEIRYEQM